ncbi:MAG: TonB-dependent receptor [Campylobacterales bacterium]|nr:TonB-dependent receptor [Campylobacterales bacterium]
MTSTIRRVWAGAGRSSIFRPIWAITTAPTTASLQSTKPPAQPEGKRSNSDKEQYDIALKSGIYLNEKTHLAAKLSLSRSQYGLPANVYTDLQNPVWDAYSRIDKKDLNSFYLYGDYKEKAYALSLRGYYDEYRDIWSIYDDALYSSVQPKTSYDDTRLGAIAKASMTQESHKESFLFQAEQNVHNRQGGAMPNAAFQADTLKASYLHEWALSEDLKFEGGLSYTQLQAKKESGAGALNPAEDKEALDAQAKLSHTGDESTLYASISKKSRMPSMVEMFTFFPFPWITANPGLKPEKSLQYSGGYQQMLGETSLIDLSLYYYDIRDLIVSSSMSYSNREKAKHYGAELRMESEAYERHQLRLSYAYAHSRDSEEKALVLIPEHRVKLEDTLAIAKAWKGYLSYQYLGARYSTNTATYSEELKRLGVCHLLEAQALYEISVQTKLRVGIKNLLDEAYEWKYGYPTQGRSYYVSLQSAF